MKHSLFTLLGFMAALTGHAQIVGETFTASGVQYQITDIENLEVCIIGADFQNNTTLVIPESVYYKFANYAVTKLTATFKENTVITGVSGGNNLKTISDDAFYGCTGLRSVNLSSKDAVWGKEVFWNCTALEKATIDGSIANATNLFSYCKALTSVTFGDNIGTTIPKECFISCSSLTAVNNLQSITTIGESSFMYASALEEIEWPEGLTRIDDKAFCRTGLKEVTIGADLSLGSGVFMSSGLTTVTFENGTTEIPASVCEGCAGLTTVNIPWSVETIGQQAFRTASALETITIPGGVTAIGKEAFNECKALKTVTLQPQTPPQMLDPDNDYTFSSTTYQTATLQVPKGTLDTYKSAFIWKNFRDIEDTVISSVEEVEAPSQTSAKYYNLYGIPVDNPSDGIFIKVSGNTAEKIIL